MNAASDRCNEEDPDITQNIVRTYTPGTATAHGRRRITTLADGRGFRAHPSLFEDVRATLVLREPISS